MIPCGQCSVSLASAERDLVQFSDGTVVHKGNCERRYQRANPKTKVLAVVQMQNGQPEIVRQFAIGATG